MSKKTIEIRGLMDSAESLHVKIPMLVRIADVSCGNGGTTVLKVSLAMRCNLPVFCPKMLPQVTSAISTFYASKGIKFMQHIPIANTKTSGEKKEPTSMGA